MNLAVILAGGLGTRLGAEQPKQFLRIAGRMVLEHTLDAFQHHPRIDEITVVYPPGYRYLVARACGDAGYDKVQCLLPGGGERYLSTLAALRAYTDDDIRVLIHDAVRPFISAAVIDSCLDRLAEFNAVDTAIRASDTIIEVDDDEMITSVPERRNMRIGQTPQGFHLGTLREAYNRALHDPNFYTTDDCGVVVRYMPEVPVSVVGGEAENQKITYRQDLPLFDRLYQVRTARLSKREVMPSARQQLTGRVLVIFGGHTGIGAATAALCHSYGARVYPFSLSRDGIDVADPAAVASALEQVRAQAGQIDGVINTAAVFTHKPFIDMSQVEIDRGITTNFVANTVVARAAFPYLGVTGGQLLLFTSSAHTRGRAGYSIYSATKAAVVNFAQAVAEEWHDAGVRVNCINPERTRTPLRQETFGLEPEGTLIEPEEVACVAVSVLGSDFSGQVVDVRVADP